MKAAADAGLICSPAGGRSAHKHKYRVVNYAPHADTVHVCFSRLCVAPGPGLAVQLSRPQGVKAGEKASEEAGLRHGGSAEERAVGR